MKLMCEELFIFLLFLGLQVKSSITQTFLVEAQHGLLQKVIAIQNSHLEHTLIREGKGLRNTVFVNPMVGWSGHVTQEVTVLDILVTRVENRLIARTGWDFIWDLMTWQRKSNVQFVRKCSQPAKTCIITWGFTPKNAHICVKYARRHSGVHMNWQATGRYTPRRRTMFVIYVAMQQYTKLTSRSIRRDTFVSSVLNVMSVGKVVTQTVSSRLTKRFIQVRNLSNVMHATRHTSTNTT